MAKNYTMITVWTMLVNSACTPQGRSMEEARNSPSVPQFFIYVLFHTVLAGHNRSERQMLEVVGASLGARTSGLGRALPIEHGPVEL